MVGLGGSSAWLGGGVWFGFVVVSVDVVSSVVLVVFLGGGREGAFFFLNPS